MTDQADKLRALVGASSLAPDAGEGALPMVVVTGARAGEGATTVALNLAAVLSDRGEHVLVVDGAQQRNDLLNPVEGRRDVRNSLADVLSGKCAISECIAQGPVGVKMLLNRWSPRTSPDFSRHAQHRLLTELQSLDGGFDLIVIDAGRGLTAWSRRFWSRAKLNLLVTTPNDAAVLGAYAVLKENAAEAAHRPVHLLVNQAVSDAVANETQQRIENACQRFLSRSIPALPSLPRHMAGDFARAQAAPRVWEMPNTPFGHAALWLGRAVSDYLAAGNRNVDLAVPDECLVAASGEA